MHKVSQNDLNSQYLPDEVVEELPRGHEIVPSASLPRSFFRGNRPNGPRDRFEEGEHFRYVGPGVPQ